MASPAKTARFSSIVDECGQPEVVVLWSPPEQDPAFQKALRQSRIMTVREVSKKKDYGTVGYLPGNKVLLLIFPKSLKPLEGLKIVGIDYSKVKQPPPVAAESSASKSKKSQETASTRPVQAAVKRVHGADGAKTLKQFQVVIRFTATLDKTVELEAESQSKAKEKAEETAKTEQVDFSEATVHSRLLRIVRGKTQLGK